ncbi:hypothetical protein MYX82_10615 [Acidobacteria bacterium AH-259-D05]|nr:hypothetical protein [Acidobacteria bacterium AH-259-D05]
MTEKKTSGEAEEEREKHIQDAARDAANASCQMTAVKWLMEWQEKQHDTKSPYYIHHNPELKRAKPLVEALKRSNLWPWKEE